jgi:hypothetical protein
MNTIKLEELLTTISGQLEKVVVSLDRMETSNEYMIELMENEADEYMSWSIDTDLDETPFDETKWSTKNLEKLFNDIGIINPKENMPILVEKNKIASDDSDIEVQTIKDKKSGKNIIKFPKG